MAGLLYFYAKCWFMKYIILSIWVLFGCALGAQSKYRIDAKQKSKLIKAGNSYPVYIEAYLDDNEVVLKKNEYPALSDPTNYVKALKKSKTGKSVCIECYEAEYKRQTAYLDSVNFVRSEKLRIAQQVADSIESENLNRKRAKRFNSKEKPFDRFIFAMDMLGAKNGVKHGNFTVFTNMDEELVRTRFSLYLQSIGFTYGAEAKQINKPGLVQEYYIQKVAIDKEVNDYIQLKYYYTVDNKLPSYYASTLGIDAPCWIVDKVVIDGTANTILNLYISYWAQSKKTVGSNKIGELASHIFMGDKISLQYMSYNKYRIEITGKRMDYYNSYNILEKND